MLFDGAEFTVQDIPRKGKTGLLLLSQSGETKDLHRCLEISHLHDLITIGVLVAFIDYIHRFFMPLKEISNKFAVLQHALAALEKIFGTFEHVAYVSTPQVFGGAGAFSHTVASASDGLSFYFTNGANIASGELVLYGLKK